MLPHGLMPTRPVSASQCNLWLFPASQEIQEEDQVGQGIQQTRKEKQMADTHPGLHQHERA
jgi:hypothetical protein